MRKRSTATATVARMTQSIRGATRSASQHGVRRDFVFSCFENLRNIFVLFSKIKRNTKIYEPYNTVRSAPHLSTPQPTRIMSTPTPNHQPKHQQQDRRDHQANQETNKLASTITHNRKPATRRSLCANAVASCRLEREAYADAWG